MENNNMIDLNFRNKIVNISINDNIEYFYNNYKGAWHSMIIKSFHTIQEHDRTAIIFDSILGTLEYDKKYIIPNEEIFVKIVTSHIYHKCKTFIRMRNFDTRKIHYIKDNEGLPILIHFDSMENYDNVLIDDTNSIQDIDTKIAIEQDNRLTEKEKTLLKLYLNDYAISDLQSSKILGVSPYKIKSMKNNIFAKLKKLNIL